MEPNSSFKDRLRQAVAAHARTSRESPVGPARGEGFDPHGSEATRRLIEELLDGSWRETDRGDAFVRDAVYPLEHVHGRVALKTLLDCSEAALRAVLLEDDVPAVGRLGFLDLETTGLSGGTGTYFFLAGLGTFTDAGFRLRQYFLADLRHEPAMLSVLARDLRQLDAVVTYNGRSFDLPCIETRMLLAREASPIGDLMSVDLLHAVRRLYRHRLSSCRLSEAEERLLGVERRDDLPGWLAPSLYFDYLRAGRIAPLRGVIRHNSDDILSTAALLAYIARLFDQPSLDPRDAAALARWWEHANDTERARSLYDVALPALEGKEDWDWAAQRHAFLLKRAGERRKAAELWERLWDQGSRRAGLELAIHLEHHARELEGAEKITRNLLAEAAGAERAALLHRLRRLERKRRRRAQAGMVRRRRFNLPG